MIEFKCVIYCKSSWWQTPSRQIQRLVILPKDDLFGFIQAAFLLIYSDLSNVRFQV